MTPTNQRTPRAKASISADDVIRYLQKHPSFLRDHPEVVAFLSPPDKSQGDDVLDLQHFMVERLQKEIADLKSNQRELLSASQVNLSSQERIHAAVLAVIEARTLEDIGRIVAEDYRSILDVTTSSLCFENKDQNGLRNIVSLKPGTIAKLMGDRSILLRHDINGDEQLYGKDSTAVRSDALVLIDLGEQSGPGLLALGSNDVERFHAGQGTELLGFMARAITGALRAGLSAA